MYGHICTHHGGGQEWHSSSRCSYACTPIPTPTPTHPFPHAAVLPTPTASLHGECVGMSEVHSTSAMQGREGASTHHTDFFSPGASFAACVRYPPHFPSQYAGLLTVWPPSRCRFDIIGMLC